MWYVNSLMAEQADIFNYIPWILVGVCGVILLISLIVGFVKGFRRIGFGGLTLGIACGGYLAVQLLLGDANPVNAIALPDTLSAAVKGLILSAITAVACIVIALIIMGLITLAVRPKEKAANHYVVNASRDEDDELFDDDYEDDEVVDQRSLAKELAGSGKPCLFNRILGGIFSLVNTAVILAFVVGMLLLACNVTPLRDTVLKATYETEWVVFAFGYVQSYAIDFLIIAIIMGCISNGFRSGIVDGIRSVFLKIGYLVAFVGGIYLAFSPFAEEGQPLAFLNNFVTMISTPLQEAAPMVTADIAIIAGKIVVGIVFGLLLDIVVFIIGWLLGKVAQASEESGVIGFIDGVLSAIFHIVIGVVIVALLALILYCLQQYNVFNVGALFNENTSLMNGLFALFEEHILPLLQTYFQLG